MERHKRHPRSRWICSNENRPSEDGIEWSLRRGVKNTTPEQSGDSREERDGKDHCQLSRVAPTEANQAAQPPYASCLGQQPAPHPKPVRLEFYRARIAVLALP